MACPKAFHVHDRGPRLEKVLKEAGATADADKVKAICESLKGKKFSELVAEGSKALG